MKKDIEKEEPRFRLGMLAIDLDFDLEKYENDPWYRLIWDDFHLMLLFEQWDKEKWREQVGDPLPSS